MPASGLRVKDVGKFHLCAFSQHDYFIRFTRNKNATD